MTKNNLNFLKSLITSDFSLINPMFLNVSTAPIQATIGFSKQQIYGNLDLLTLNRSLKQFIRTVQFFNRKRGVFTLFIKDLNFKTLMSELLSNQLDSERLVLSSIVRKTKASAFNCRSVNPALLLEEEFSSVGYLQKFPQIKHYLINIISLAQNIACLGSYYTRNDMLSVSKRSYVGVLLGATLKLPQKPVKNTKKKVEKRKAVKLAKSFKDRATALAAKKNL